jgi:hypothetical protein
MLHGMLIYRIVRVIGERCSIHNLSCTFPKINRYIDIVLVGLDDGFRQVRKIKLDPKALTKVLLAITPEN